MSKVDDAGKKLDEAIGGDVAQALLRKIGKNEKFNTKDFLIEVNKKVAMSKNPFDEKKLNLLIGKNGVIDLLCKSFWTRRNSNFVKLVGRRTTNGDLKSYLLDGNNMKTKLKLDNIKNSLQTYLDLGVEKQQITVHDTVGTHVEITKRGKHKDAGGKMQGSLINRMKCVATAWICGLIDKKTCDIAGPTEIEEQQYIGNKKLKEIELPDSVTKIGPEAFKDCINLETVIIPNSVTEIETSAFENCQNLTTINIPNKINKINPRTFAGCSELKNLTIPDSVVEIAESAFLLCSKLENIDLPNSVKSIGIHAFTNCTSLKTINIPESVSCIENEAFRSCTNLQSIEIPELISTINDGTFNGCKNLKSVTILTESALTIGNGAFYNCINLRKIIIPNSQDLPKIASDAFSRCHGEKMDIQAQEIIKASIKKQL